MKPTSLQSPVSHETILGILMACAMALIPASTWAQHAAPRAGHPTPPAAAAPRTGMVRAPHVPSTSFHSPVAPFRFFAPSVRRRHFPIFPVVAWPGFFGLGYGAYWYPNCDGYAGWGYACGPWSPYYSYAPEPAPPDEYAAGGLSGENLDMEDSVGEPLPRKILLFSKDGSVFGVASYSIANGKLHYVSGYGGENDIDLDLLDVQKTIDKNAARGVTFRLTPSTPAPAPSSATPPSNQ